MKTEFNMPSIEILLFDTDEVLTISAKPNTNEQEAKKSALDRQVNQVVVFNVLPKN